MFKKKVYSNNIEEVLISGRQIRKAVKKAAKWIDAKYADEKEEIVLVGLLKGSIPFIGQLVTNIERDVVLDFMVVSSFKGKDKAQGKPEIITNIGTNIKNKHVLLVEDIVDSGYTIKYVKDILEKQKPKSIGTISLLDKPTGRKVDLNVDYSCFTIPHKFIVGYGLDYKEKCRNYDCIAVLKKEIIEKETYNG